MNIGISKTVGLALSIVAAGAFAQVANFNTDNNVMTLSSVRVGGQYFAGVNVFLPPNGGYWQVVGAPSNKNPLAVSEPASYANSQLWIPLTQIGTTTYTDLTLNLPINGPWNIASQGNTYATYSSGYDVEWPIRSRVKNSFNDSGGEHTYQLTNGQYWKHVADEPCMPAAAATDTENYSDVEIFPNPGFSGSSGVSEGNFRFVAYYPSKANAIAVETCLVIPFYGVYPGGGGGSSLNALAVNPATVSVGVNEERNVFLSGGTVPYLVRTDNPGVVNFNFLPQSSAQSGQSLRIQALREGTATLTVFDFNRQSIAIPVTVSSSSTQFFVMPSKVGPLDYRKGNSQTIRLYGGTPPYSVMQIWDSSTISVGDIQGDGSVSISFKCPDKTFTGKIENFFVVFKDAKGRESVFQYTIDYKANACSPTGGTTGPGTLG